MTTKAKKVSKVQRLKARLAVSKKDLTNVRELLEGVATRGVYVHYRKPTKRQERLSGCFPDGKLKTRQELVDVALSLFGFIAAQDRQIESLNRTISSLEKKEAPAPAC